MDTGNDCSPGLTGDGDMTTLCWFPFYPGDWLSSMTIQTFTAQQKGWYIELLSHQWKEGGYLPKDGEVLATVCKVHGIGGQSEEESDFIDVLDKFPVQPNGKRANVKLLDIYNRQLKRHQAMSKGGKKHLDGTIEPPTDVDSDSVLISIFNELWKAYPSKTGSKEKAFSAWQKWSKAGDTKEQALDGIARYVAYVEASRKGGFPDLKYQNGQTFFNGRGWTSEWTFVAKKKVESFI